MTKPEIKPHTNEDEYLFIDGIGKHSSGSAKALGRKLLLRGYLDACEKLADWGYMSKPAVIAYAGDAYDKA